MFSLKELEQAMKGVHQVMVPTPTHSWPQLCVRTGCDVWVKHENHTPTTAFKVRGGITLLNHLKQQQQPLKGLISATRGNHGQSLAFSGQRAGVPVTIVVPKGNSADQNRAIRGFGAEVIEHGEDFEAARAHSLELQSQYGYRLVAAFERELMLGVATYALEMMLKLKDLDTVYVSIGMGSGICGLIKTRDLLGLKTKIVGVVSEGAPTFSLSFNAGHIIQTDSVNTIADGIATSAPIPDAFEIIKKGADRIITVSDDEIEDAMYYYFHDTHNLAEGAGAAPLAGLMKEHQKMKGKKVGLIFSGGNIDFGRFKEYVSRARNRMSAN